MCIILIAVVTLSFAACTPKSAFDFDKDAAVKRAKEVIDVVNTRDYTALFNTFSADVQKLTTAEGLKTSFEPTLAPLGAFSEYQSAEAISQIDKNGAKYINVFLKTKYEKGTHVYEVTLDTDMKLQGIHITA